MQQLPHLGAVKLVPCNGVISAVGGIKIIQQILAAEHTFLRGRGDHRLRQGLAVLLYVLHCADRHVGVVRFAGFVHLFQVRRAHHIVAVNKGIIAAAGHINAGVARAGKPLVLLVHHFNAVVPLGKAVTQSAATIRCAVIDQQHLDRAVAGREILVQNALHALFQPGLCVVNGNDHTNCNMFHLVFPPHSSVRFAAMQLAAGVCQRVGQPRCGAEQHSARFFGTGHMRAAQDVR